MQTIINFITNIISSHGYLATAILMAIESCNIPVPSEIVIPYSGFLVVKEGFSFWGVVLASSIGCLIGSDISYLIGRWGGRPFLEKYGKYLLITKKDIAISERWFDKYGEWTTLISRMLPFIRTFISLPLGIYKVNFWKFNLFTLIGSFLWSILLTYLGVIAGNNWEIVQKYIEKFSFLIVFITIIAIVYFIYHKVRELKK
ncbi:MAG: DedA family protein [Patescibacteria group bacterium]|nr:DedA family protein [Patescibacteria group bacterium]